MRTKDFINRNHIKEVCNTENQYIGGEEGIPRRGETRYQCLVEGADTNNSIQPQGKLKNQTAWQSIGSALTGAIENASTAVDVKNFDLIRFKVTALDPAGQTDQAQTLTPSAAPSSGTYKINIGSQQTAAIAYNATANQIRDAIRLLTGFANVTVTGTLATTVVITMAGVISSTPLIVISDSTLSDGSPVTLTPTISTAFVQGSEITFIASGFWD